MSDGKHNDPDIRPVEQQIRDGRLLHPTPPIPRSFKTSFSPDFLKDYHRGVMNYTYRGVSCLKSPIDLAIYMLMIQDLRPQTIIEIGSFHGGAALFYRDICRTLDLDTEIITMDFRALGDNASDDIRQGVSFIQADAMELENSLLEERLETLARPLMVIEDSAHTRDVCYAVLEYFRTRLRPGEYLIMEDGVIEDQGAAARYGGGPNLAIHDFFAAYPDSFEIDTHYNDFFGTNTSFNPNGYLRKSDHG